MSGNISGRLDRATASRSFTKRAPLGVRIMLAAFAVLAIAFAVLAGVNIDAQRQRISRPRPATTPISSNC